MVGKGDIMAEWKEIGKKYVDYLVETGQIDAEDWETTYMAILDGDLGISKAWLVEKIYEGDEVSMEAECGYMVRKDAEFNRIFEACGGSHRKNSEEGVCARHSNPLPCRVCNTHDERGRFKKGRHPYSPKNSETFESTDWDEASWGEDFIAQVYSGDAPQMLYLELWLNSGAASSVFGLNLQDFQITRKFLYEELTDEEVIGYDKRMWLTVYKWWYDMSDEEKEEAIDEDIFIKYYDDALESYGDAWSEEEDETWYDAETYSWKKQPRDVKGRFTTKKFVKERVATEITDEELEELFPEPEQEEETLDLGEFVVPEEEEMEPVLGEIEAEELMEYLETCLNDEEFPDKYLEDEEFQDYFHNVVWATDESLLQGIKDMFEGMSAMSSLTADPHFIGFANRGELLSQMMLDVKSQQKMYSAEDSEVFEGMSKFPPGKHDVTDAEKALKTKHPSVTAINSYEYLVVQEGTSNKFHVFFDTNAGYYSVYGRIGYGSKKSRVVGPMGYSKYYDKIRQKMRKGYQKMKV